MLKQGQGKIINTASIAGLVGFAQSGAYCASKGSTYKTLSGTSMAAPHVTGVAALVIDKKTCDFDLNGVCTPAEVQQRLEATAEDLGVVDKDNLYGAGLVDAEKAVVQ